MTYYADPFAPTLQAQGQGFQNRLGRASVGTGYLAEAMAQRHEEANKEADRQRKLQQFAALAQIFEAAKNNAAAPAPGTIGPTSPDQVRENYRTGILNQMPALVRTAGPEGMDMGFGAFKNLAPIPYEPISRADQVAYQRDMHPEAFDMWHGYGPRGRQLPNTTGTPGEISHAERDYRILQAKNDKAWQEYEKERADYEQALKSEKAKGDAEWSKKATIRIAEIENYQRKILERYLANDQPGSDVSFPTISGNDDNSQWW